MPVQLRYRSTAPATDQHRIMCTLFDVDPFRRTPAITYNQSNWPIAHAVHAGFNHAE
jgi:hypothetical protein